MRLIIGFAILVIGTLQVYKTARKSGRLPGRWALLNLALGIAFQLVIPIGVAMVLALALFASTEDESSINVAQLETLNFYGNLVGIVGILMSIISLFFIMRHVIRVPDRPVAVDAPPPPPEFGDNIQ